MRCDIRLCHDCAALLRKIQATSSEQRMADAVGVVLLDCPTCREQLPAELIEQLQDGARMEIARYCGASAPTGSVLTHHCACYLLRHTGSQHECRCGRTWLAKEGA